MLKNTALIAPLAAWTIAQLLKFLLDAAAKRKPDFTRLVNPGGMPSSHSNPRILHVSYDGKDLRLGITSLCYGDCLVPYSPI